MELYFICILGYCTTFQKWENHQDLEMKSFGKENVTEYARCAIQLMVYVTQTFNESINYSCN